MTTLSEYTTVVSAYRARSEGRLCSPAIWKPDPNNAVHTHAGVKQRPKASAEPIPRTSTNEVAMTRRSFLSSLRVPATKGKVLFTTADEKEKITLPTIATAA